MNAMAIEGFTALGCACALLKPGFVNNVVTELLLSEDIDANLGELSPLHAALQMGQDWSLIHQLLVWNPAKFSPIDVNCKSQWGATALHLAATGGDLHVFDGLLQAYPTMDAGLQDDCGWVPLHYAACFGNSKVIQRVLVIKPELVNATENEWRLSPLHFAVLSNSPDAVQAILKAGGKDLKVDQPDWEGSTPLDYARSWYLDRKIIYKGFPSEAILITRDNAKRMVKILEGFNIHGLRNERQVYVDSANAILVGGALIASVTFSSWLQPPLGLTPYYENQIFMPSLVLLESYESFVAINDHWTIEMFWIFNTLSSFFAVATITGGADVALPTRGLLLKDAVRHAVLCASCLLVVSTMCVIGAFSSIGFTVLPPLYKYRRNMIGSVCVWRLSMCICLVESCKKGM